ncbi:hypothetical protein ACMY0W_12690, partial [Bacteroides sp. KG69]|uniref:hypothetical protein n=1 Tax=Bacteroides sp. KG69 TaxID=3397825 RepID=UPI003D979689
MPTRISHKSLKQIIIISQKIFSTQNTIYEQYKTATTKKQQKKIKYNIADFKEMPTFATAIGRDD